MDNIDEHYVHSLQFLERVTHLCFDTESESFCDKFALAVHSERPDIFKSLIWWIISEFCADYVENDSDLIKAVHEFTINNINLVSAAVH